MDLLRRAGFALLLFAGCMDPGPTAVGEAPDLAPDTDHGTQWLNQTLQGDLGFAPCVMVPSGPCMGPASVESRRALPTAVRSNITAGQATLSWEASSPAMEELTFVAGPVIPCPDDPDLEFYCFSAAGDAVTTKGASPLRVGLAGMAVPEGSILAVWVHAPQVDAGAGAGARLYLPQPFSVDVAALLLQAN